MGSGISNPHIEINKEYCRTLVGSRFNNELFDYYASKSNSVISKDTLLRLECMKHDACLIRFEADSSTYLESVLQLTHEKLIVENLLISIVCGKKDDDIRTIEASQSLVIFLTEEHRSRIISGLDKDSKIFLDLIRQFTNESRINHVVVHDTVTKRKSLDSIDTDISTNDSADVIVAQLVSELTSAIVPLRHWQGGLTIADDPRSTMEVSKDMVADIASRPPVSIRFAGTGVELSGHEDAVTALVLTPTGALFSGCEDGTILQWGLDETSGNHRVVRKLCDHSQYVSCLVLITDDLLVSGSGDGSLKLWVPSTGRSGGTLSGHTSGVRCVLRCGRRLVSGGEDAVLRLWDVAEYRQVRAVSGAEGYITSLAGAGEHVVVGSEAGGKVRVYDLEAGSVRAVLEAHPGAWVTGLALTTAGDLVSCAEDGTLTVWRRGTDGGAPFDAVFTTRPPSMVKVLLALPDGRFVSGDEEGAVDVWSGADRHYSSVQRLSGHREAVTALGWSVGGYLVSGSFDTHLRVWTTVH